MNDVQINELEKSIRQEIEDFDPKEKMKLDQRATRRAIAINIVATARTHGGRQDELYNQRDADAVVAIMEILNRVAEE